MVIYMNSIKSIMYVINGRSLVINLGVENRIMYDDISVVVSNEKIFEYLSKLYLIIDDWDSEYINTNMIDGGVWNLSIIYFDGRKKEYRGKAAYPSNFEAFERLNRKLLNEVLNG